MNVVLYILFLTARFVSYMYDFLLTNLSFIECWMCEVCVGLLQLSLVIQHDDRSVLWLGMQRSLFSNILVVLCITGNFLTYTSIFVCVAPAVVL